MPENLENSKFKIFLSHKSKDEALARALAEILIEPCSGLMEVYLMETIPASTEWRVWIKESLAQSSMLLLLFTDETLEWDWCLYEAGLFAGVKAMAFHKIVCIHDPKVDRPRQLEDLQTIPAETLRVSQFLTDLYLNTREKWGFQILAPKAPLDRMTKAIIDLLLQRTPVKTARYGKQMEVVIQSSNVPTGEDTQVSGDALSMFGLTSPQPWAKLEEKCTGLDGNLWFKELAKTLNIAREGSEVPPPIQSRFHPPGDANKKDYRPCLYKGEWKRQGEVRFSILFSEEPSFNENVDITRPIANFGELIKGLVELIDEAPKGDWIRILTLTPALGFLAKSQNEWDALEKRISDNRDRIEMVCQTSSSLAEWHAAFKGRKTQRRNLANDLIDDDLIENANSASKRIVELISANKTYHELPWADMPDIYLFSAKNRAIVVAPFHLPRLDQPSVKRPFSLPYVEMFGSATNDFYIVKQVQDMHNHYVGEAIKYAENLLAKAKGASSGA